MAYNRIPRPTDASIILTYRCPMRCVMCNIWKNPTKRTEELKAEDLRSLPQLKFINLTGGEPFIREDLPEIVEECYKHTLAQIDSKDYALPYKADGRRVFKVGVNFSTSEKTVVEWKYIKA